jgi:hypothetical protein
MANDDFEELIIDDETVKKALNGPSGISPDTYRALSQVARVNPNNIMDEPFKNEEVKEDPYHYNKRVLNNFKNGIADTLRQKGISTVDMNVVNEYKNYIFKYTEALFVKDDMKNKLLGFTYNLANIDIHSREKLDLTLGLKSDSPTDTPTGETIKDKLTFPVVLVNKWHYVVEAHIFLKGSGTTVEAHVIPLTDNIRERFLI